MKQLLKILIDLITILKKFDLMRYKICNCKFCIFIIVFIISISINNNESINKKIINNITNSKYKYNKLIKENFFVIDSNRLEHVCSHMYGFSISEKGILTDNYYKLIGDYKDPEPQGTYIMIRRNKNKIILNQDIYGGYGLYLYENKNSNYFALSNSFLFLEEYLIGKQNFTFNKDFADNFIISELCTFSLNETLIKEIYQIPPNSNIIINIKKKSFKINYIDYKENTVPLESEEGLKIIDRWIDKWGYILRSLKNQTDNISFDLSGGFDTRTLLPVLLNSGVNLNEILIKSYKNKEHGHDEDFIIARNISTKLGFKLNNLTFNRNSTKFGIENTIYGSMFSKLGFHKEFYFKNEFYNKPRFSFRGAGGESLRGYPGEPIAEFIDRNSYKNIKSHEKEFYHSSKRIFNRSISILKNNLTFNNDYEISAVLYSKALGRNHFGKESLEAYFANIYFIEPLMDPVIKKIKYDISGPLPHDLISYIYIRFARELINFPFQGNRSLNFKSIQKAEKLNNDFIPYKIKSNYNKNFYIDIKRKTAAKHKSDNIIVNDYFIKLFNSIQFFNIINKKYGMEVYNWAKNYIKNSKYFPLRHAYGLLAVGVTIKNLLLNEINMNYSVYKNELKFIKNIINFKIY